MADPKDEKKAAATPAAAEKKTETADVDPALDNRTGDQRPHLSDEVKPQQVDGPEVGHLAEHAEKFPATDSEAEGEVLGAKSEGPHGRGPHGVTVGDAHGQPVEPQAGAGDANDPRNPAG